MHHNILKQTCMIMCVLSCHTKQLISSYPLRVAAESLVTSTLVTACALSMNRLHWSRLIWYLKLQMRTLKKQVLPIDARTLLWSDEWVLFSEEFETMLLETWGIHLTSILEKKCTQNWEAFKILKNTSLGMQFQDAKKMHLEWQISHVPRPPGMPKSDL